MWSAVNWRRRELRYHIKGWPTQLHGFPKTVRGGRDTKTKPTIISLTSGSDHLVVMNSVNTTRTRARTHAHTHTSIRQFVSFLCGQCAICMKVTYLLPHQGHRVCLSVRIINDLVDHKISLQNLIRTISDIKKNPCPFSQPVFTSKISYTRRILVFILHIQLLPE